MTFCQREQGALIPRIIHQTWKNKFVPVQFIYPMCSWLQMHATWKHRLWTDDQNDRLIKTKYKKLYPLYRSLSNIQQADIARYAILHRLVASIFAVVFVVSGNNSSAFLLTAGTVVYMLIWTQKVCVPSALGSSEWKVASCATHLRLPL